MAVNLMGFKKVSQIPEVHTRPHGRNIYEPLLFEVQKNGGIYALDTKDDKRAKSLVGTLRANIKRLELTRVMVVKRETTVYLTNNE